MKILLSAYACEPWRGSEPDVGFQTMLTLASEHQVWVLTRQNNLELLGEYLSTDDRSANITLIGLDLSQTALRLKRLGMPGQIWYYDRWQKAAGIRARQLADEVDFDVAYHITFAAYWMRTGVAEAGLPLVLGPVGGGVEPPISMVGELGWRGFLEDALRVTGRRLMALLPAVRRGPRLASHVFVNNSQTADRIRPLTQAPIEVLPNPTAVVVPSDLPSRIPEPSIYFVARLVPWKGAALAVRAMRYVRTEGAHLVINGDGPDRSRLEGRIRRWKLEGNVRLAGQVPREELLRRLAHAGVLVHPALHEEGGNAVAEALAMQVPVVCIDRGGPPVTVTLFPSVPSSVISTGFPTKTARAMAAAIDDMLKRAGPRSGDTLAPQLSFKETLLETVLRVAEGSRRPR